MFHGINGRVSRIVNLRRRGGIGGILLGGDEDTKRTRPGSEQTLLGGGGEK